VTVIIDIPKKLTSNQKDLLRNSAKPWVKRTAIKKNICLRKKRSEGNVIHGPLCAPVCGRREGTAPGKTSFVRACFAGPHNPPRRCDPLSPQISVFIRQTDISMGKSAVLFPPRSGLRGVPLKFDLRPSEMNSAGLRRHPAASSLAAEPFSASLRTSVPTVEETFQWEKSTVLFSHCLL
jgi:hypothetical protein